MSDALMNKRWLLRKRPEADITNEQLELVTEPVPELNEGEVLVRNIYLSLDPTHRLWMSDREQYLPPVEVGQVMRGGTLGVVEKSRSERFAAGDFVKPMAGGWELYTVAPEKLLTKVNHNNPDIPLSAWMSVLGSTGITSYFGLLDIGNPQPGETVVVTAAAGAVGSIVGQIAKLKGCRVIGIAGGPEKCRWLTEELGFDGAIDYRSDNVPEALDRLCPDGVDVQFENVGGEIMDAVFNRLNLNGRLSLCGMISGYNDERPMSGPTDFGRILMKRITVKGFIVIDYRPRFPEALEELQQWVAEGKIQWKDHIIDGIDNALDGLSLLFSGKNNGKLMVRLSQEP
ncbi:NADP-dependent oxidoreductase [uncultured Marinobacter sp.]|uniref:NADP-dependent oxidoreductase n=1 Tax=uncultured Marinobacter sp. TaxID=187379 RepID=UPI0030DA9605